MPFFRSKDVECKRVFGQTYCRVSASGMTAMFPTSAKHGIPLNFYTSKTCPDNICKSTYKQLVKMNTELNNLYNIKVVQADKARTPAQVLTIPTILIGNQTIIGKDFDKISLIQATQRSFNQLV